MNGFVQMNLPKGVVGQVEELQQFSKTQNSVWGFNSVVQFPFSAVEQKEFIRN